MKKTVTVFVQRHGQKGPGPNDLATLTEKGRQDVMASAANNLMNVTFQGLYCSLKFRTLETVVCATSALPNRNSGLSVIAKAGFDYSSAPDLDKFNDLAAEVKRRSEEKNIPITVALWREVAPAMIGHLRKQMISALKEVAIEISKNSDGDNLNVLVGSHSPTSELACLDPATMPLLQEADIVKYTVLVDNEDGCDGTGIFANIIGSEYVPRGF